MTTQEDSAYGIAAAKSYAGQQTEFSIRVGKDPVEIPLGFQPLGINVLGSLIAVAAYFEPAVMLAEVTVLEGVLRFHNVRWIRGTVHDGSPVRMFPDVFQPGGANRMQTALICSPERLGLIRNGERRMFFIERGADSKWHHNGTVFFPDSGYAFVHSAIIEDGHLYTTESDGPLENWVTCSYRFNGSEIQRYFYYAITHYRYLGARGANGQFYSIGDVRAKCKGIFAGGQPISDVPGNGIALLKNGEVGALVTRYGQAYPGPFNGIPGTLVYVPPRLLL